MIATDKIVYKQGFGVKRKVGTPATRFMIASNTKALTTLLLKKLIM